MSSPVSTSPSYYQIANEKFEQIKSTINKQVKNLPEDSKDILNIALPAIAVASVAYATAPVTIAFVAAVILGNKLAPSLISKTAAGRVLMAVGATIFAVKIAIPFRTIVSYAAGSLALGVAGYTYGTTGNFPGTSYLQSERPITRKY